MSSGLVPITNSAGAIPEFVDHECGILAEREDALGLAAGIALLYEDPALFLELSLRAAQRVRRQSGPDQTTAREMSLIVGAVRE
jgi:glycosyltransferase involved in cell wall biosynthesis